MVGSVAEVYGGKYWTPVEIRADMCGYYLGELSHQTFLHFQHAYYSTDCIGLQPLLCVTTTLQPRSNKRTCTSPWKVARRRRRRTVHPRWRHCLLHFSTKLLRRSYLRSIPRCLLPHLYSDSMRPLLKDLD